MKFQRHYLRFGSLQPPCGRFLIGWRPGHKAQKQCMVRDRQACSTAISSLSYKDAGVDIDAGAELVRRIQKLNPNIGGFSGLVPFGDSYLVAGTDGVGTKLKLAFDLNKHDSIGIDLVAMSVNDIITSGAKPLFFLDYYATGKLDVDVAESVVKGIVDGCQQSDCALLGGETAEMPGFYKEGEYDVAGFAVGSVKKDEVIDGKSIKDGDVVIGLPSTGVHSNGFSLARKILEGLVHITGGGFTENIPRVLPKGYGVSIRQNSWEIPQLFRWMQEAGNVSDSEMFRTFNMGIGMVVIVDPCDADKVQELEPSACVLGSVVSKEGVELNV